MTTQTNTSTLSVAEAARRTLPELVRVGDRLGASRGGTCLRPRSRPCRTSTRTRGMRLRDRGDFVAPTVLDDATSDVWVVREAIFGPVGALLSFTDVDDAIAKANQTEDVPASSVWTTDLSTAHRIADGIEAGTAWVNTHHEMTTGALPFSGFKQSGVGGRTAPR